MEILYRRSALLSVDRYDEFRRKYGYEPMGHEILAAIEARLEVVRTWDEIATPVYRVRNGCPSAAGSSRRTFARAHNLGLLS